MKFIWSTLFKFRGITASIGSINESIPLLAKEIESHLVFSLYNISYRNYESQDFPLHEAVFKNDLRKIRKICALEETDYYYDINEPDPNDNTPLMLAIKMNHHDAIRILCDHEADVRHKSFEGDISPIEYAIRTKNKKLIKILAFAYNKQKLDFWQGYKEVSINLKS